MSIIIAPSILAADFGKLAEEIKDIERCGADWLHIDVMDGTYVPPITFGANMVATAKASSKLFLDVHLMIVNPDQHFKAYKDAGADRIIVHQETCPHLHRSLQAIRSLGMKNGVALNPSTPVGTVFDVLEICDLVLVMTVNPGWGGQSFIPSCTKKIEAVKSQIDKIGAKAVIEVDGGINAETAKLCQKAGASVMVAGSYVFSHSDRKSAINSLR